MGEQRKDEWPNLNDEPKVTDTDGGATGDRKTEVANELQELGQRLAATARALWQSEQRQELQQEVTDGLRLLRDQLSGAVDTVRSNPKVQSLKDQVEHKVEAGRTSDTFEDVRAGLTGGLRTLNEQLQRFTERLEQRDKPAEDTVQPAATAATEPVVSAEQSAKAEVALGELIAEAEPGVPKRDLPNAPEGPAESPR
jgi:hypothetical protein